MKQIYMILFVFLLIGSRAGSSQMETKSLINLLNFQATLIDSAEIKFLWYEKFLIPHDNIDKIHQQTLVLHEQDLPKLLRVLEENEIRRVGGTAQIHTDVRVVVSTNRNLEKAVIVKPVISYTLL